MGTKTTPAEDSAATAAWPERVALVCSSGGHLAQLYRLEPWWRTRQRQWATFDTPDARSLLAEEETVWAHHPTTRNLRNLVRNTLLAVRHLRAYRPDVVVSDGAALAVAYFVVARCLGIRCVYVEVLDRIDSRTLTGRLCAPLSDLFLVQVPQQQPLYRGSVVMGELL